MPQRRPPRTCTRCGLTKPFGQFPKEPPTWICKQCTKLERELWRANEDLIDWQADRLELAGERFLAAKADQHPEFVHKHTHGGENAKYKHGITVGQYRQLVLRQRGRCAICGEPPTSGKRLSVDHDHETGEFRGLLCGPCNTGLGFFKDDPVRMARAAEYVLDPPGIRGRM